MFLLLLFNLLPVLLPLPAPHSPTLLHTESWMKENFTGVNKTQTRSTNSLGFMRVNMKRTYYKGFEERIDNKKYCYLPSRASFEII